jgi:predicted nucleic acid-binding Zn ribbon protein
MDSPFKPKTVSANSRKSDSQSLKEAIDSLLKVYQLQNKFQETYVTANWEQIVGKPISSRTSDVYVKKEKLFLKITSAPLKKELLLTKHKLIELINKSANQEIIKEIIFL